jgi:hypothetical protein
MRLISFGCSLTWGTDLSDVSPNDYFKWSELTWPALVSKRLGMHYRTCAIGGSGNLSIMDHACKWSVQCPKDFILINWTFADRFDYSRHDGAHYNNGPKGFDTCRPNEHDDISKFYFRYLHSEYRDKLTALIYIKSTLDFLISNQRKFLMTANDDTIWCKKWHAPSHIQNFQNSIKPHVTSFENRNFLDWCRHRAFPISASGHPLEEAHAAAADLMTPVIDAILHKA